MIPGPPHPLYLLRMDLESMLVLPSHASDLMMRARVAGQLSRLPSSTGQRRSMQPVKAGARAAAQRAAAARPERFGDAFLNLLQLLRVRLGCQGAASAAAAAQQLVERGEARRLPPTNAPPIAAVRVGFGSVSRARSSGHVSVHVVTTCTVRYTIVNVNAARAFFSKRRTRSWYVRVYPDRATIKFLLS